MKKAAHNLIPVILLIVLTNVAFAGDIIYPWRAAKTIVRHGDGFEILYRNTTDTPIDSVWLAGPFNHAALRIDSVSKGHFEFDSFTKASVNNRVFVRVPPGTPEELYDLIVKAGNEVAYSPKAVKVVREFRESHRFIHISDLHVSRQWEGTPENGYAKELELLDKFVEVANIIAPDFIIVTGDNIHHYTRLNADSTGWGGTKQYEKEQLPGLEEKWRNLYEGAQGFSGIHGFTAPVFTIPGNHDYYGKTIKDDYRSMARQWNDLCGLRIYGFRYGNTRVLAMDDFLGDSVADRPENAPLSGLQGNVLQSFLEREGNGSLRILAQHIDNRTDTAFLNANKIHILLHGHRHTPAEEYIGAYPTLSTRPGTVCRSGVLNVREELGLFRIFHINGDHYSYSPPLRFTEYPQAPYSRMPVNLTLSYSLANDGKFIRNTATIVNRLGIDLPACTIRFIMKKGRYKIDKGEIFQTITSGTVSVVDVRVDVSSDGPTHVTISPI